MNALTHAGAWLLAHWPQILATAVALGALLHAVPHARWVELEQDYPRATHVVLTLRSLWAPLVAIARLLWVVWTGRPWPLPAAPAAARAVTIVPPPIEPQPPSASLRALLPLVLLAALAAPQQACSAPQTPPTGQPPSWTTVAHITIATAQAATFAAREVLGSSDLPAETRSGVDRAIVVTLDALALADTALTAYERDGATAQQCRFRVESDAAVTGLLQVLVLLEDAGLQVPPEIPAGVGALGSIADALLPGCDGSPEAPRIRMTLAHRLSR